MVVSVAPVIGLNRNRRNPHLRLRPSHPQSAHPPLPHIPPLPRTLHPPLLLLHALHRVRPAQPLRAPLRPAARRGEWGAVQWGADQRDAAV